MGGCVCVCVEIDKIPKEAQFMAGGYIQAVYAHNLLD